MLCVCFTTLYPIWYSLVYAFNDGTDAMRGGIYWWPRLFTLNNFKAVFGTNDIINAFAVSVARTVLGTLLHVFLTSMVAYAISKKYLVGRGVYLTMGTITLFFSGGLIPTFFLIKALGLYDSFFVYIFPTMFSFYELLIFQSAKIDGANDFYIFLRIVVPLSTPVLATVALFTGVGHWNDYFLGVVYINNAKLLPIQTYLYKIIALTGFDAIKLTAPEFVGSKRVTSQSLKYSTMILTMLPIIMVYPFLQKYYVKGMLLGSIKG
jgi:putative aldouronate transport system permease protein